MKTKCMFILSFFITNFLLGQTKEQTEIPVAQGDSRIFVELSHSKTAAFGFQWVNIHITNKTSDILRVRLEFTATSTSGVVESMRIGGWGNSDGYLDIKPGQRIGGDINNCQIQFYGKCKGKEIKVDDGISCIQNVTYKLISIENIKPKKNKNVGTGVRG